MAIDGGGQRLGEQVEYIFSFTDLVDVSDVPICDYRLSDTGAGLRREEYNVIRCDESPKQPFHGQYMLASLLRMNRT